MQAWAPLYLRELLVKQVNTRTLRPNTYYRYHTLIYKGSVTEHSVPMHHAFGMSSLITSRLLKCAKLQETAEDIAISKGVYLTVSIMNICPLTIL